MTLKLFKSLLADNSGATFVYGAIVLPAVIASVALAIDISMANTTQNKLQSAADAAALAGVSQIGNTGNVIAEAKRFASRNIPDENSSSVLSVSDISVGHWDGDVFSAGFTPENAVQVITRRSDINNNALPTIFGVVFGRQTFNLSATAIALSVGGSEKCFTQGLVADGIVELGSTNTLADVCLHGQSGVKISSDNVFENANSVSVVNINDVEDSSPNPGFSDAVFERDLPPQDALNINNILSDYKTGNGQLPSYLSGVVIKRKKLPRNPSPGVLYIVSNDVTLEGNVSGFGVYSSKKVTISSDANLKDMLIVSQENVEAGSNIKFGHSNFCSSGTASVFMAAKNEVKVGSNVSFFGAQILAGEYLDMGSNLMNLSGLAAQSGGDIKMGSENESGCGYPKNTLFPGGSGNAGVKLVN